DAVGLEPDGGGLVRRGDRGGGERRRRRCSVARRPRRRRFERGWPRDRADESARSALPRRRRPRQRRVGTRRRPRGAGRRGEDRRAWLAAKRSPGRPRAALLATEPEAVCGRGTGGD